MLLLKYKEISLERYFFLKRLKKAKSEYIVRFKKEALTNVDITLSNI